MAKAKETLYFIGDGMLDVNGKSFGKGEKITEELPKSEYERLMKQNKISVAPVLVQAAGDSDAEIRRLSRALGEAKVQIEELKKENKELREMLGGGDE
jgi:signal transduction protein with GAF and PtsI domain